MLQIIIEFPQKKARDIALENLRRNSYYAHPDSILVTMLADEDRHIRQKAADKILDVRTSQAMPSTSSTKVRRFITPSINTHAKTYYEMINLDDHVIEEPPVIKPMMDAQIIALVDERLIMKHPFHNQAVERHIKVVSCDIQRPSDQQESVDRSVAGNFPSAMILFRGEQLIEAPESEHLHPRNDIQ
jgi:hypothetical protein